MAHIQDRFSAAAKAASIISPKVPVTLTPSASAAAAPVNGPAGFYVYPAGSYNLRPFGVTGLASTAQGDGLAVYEEMGTVKAVAGASLGAGAEVGVGSTNGILIPVVGASGATIWAVGLALEPAAAGESFSVYIKPRQLSGAIFTT